MTISSVGDVEFAGRDSFTRERRAHWDAVAAKGKPGSWIGGYYHSRLQRVFAFHAGPDRKVLEVGCGEGNLLSACKPAQGIGVDFSPRMIEKARERHPQLDFHVVDAHDLDLDQEFDVIILSDLVNELWDVQRVFGRLARHSSSRTRLILNFYSRLWEIPLKIAEKAELAQANPPQNWLSPVDVTNLLVLAGFETVRTWNEILVPFDILGLGDAMNRIVARFWPWHYLCLTNFVVARPHPIVVRDEPKVSVVVPVRNEAGNIRSAIERAPQMGSGTELVFVEGHSQDSSYAVLQAEIAAHPDRECRLIRQVGTGKGDAVRQGFAEATGDLLMILDADLTVPPEDLVRFYNALIAGQAEFANGVRLVYPREGQAMRFLNLVGNKLFSWLISWLLGQPVKDTLCGTKALWAEDYRELANSRSQLGNFDPFGDFDLLFGAARMNLRIVDIPIRYRSRTYGSTNIDRWRHGWMLLRMVWHVAQDLRFN